MQTPIDSGDWQAEARRLRAQGHDASAIATALGKTSSAIREALKGAPRPEAEVVLGAWRSFIEPHVPRVPRVVLDRAVLKAAVLAFAQGEIDRAELLRRITR
jgi:hypothetical protein